MRFRQEVDGKISGKKIGVFTPQITLEEVSTFQDISGDVGVEPKIWVVKPPKSSTLFIGFWNHYFHHPFWGTNIFGNIQILLIGRNPVNSPVDMENI